MNYTSEQKSRLLSFPLEKVLYLCGFSTEHNRSNVYHSPLRQDKNPSFRISRHNTWIDYGTGERGGVLDLVERLRNCSRNEAFDWLAENSDVRYEMSESSVVSGEKSEAPAIGILFEEDIWFTPLLEYVASRGVALL